VYVTPSAKETLFLSGTFVASGTELVMTDVDRATRSPGPTYYMVKEEADGGRATWRFGVLESPNASREALALCARCHDEAPGDRVFALPP
jgi:cytochrome c553